MLRQTRKLVLTVVAAASLMASPAFATSFALTGALDYGLSKVGDPTVLEVKGALGYGGGLLVDFGSGHTSLELGALYIARGLSTTAFSVDAGTTHSGYIYVPVGVRFGMGSSTSLFLGGQADYFLDAPAGTSFGDKTFYALAAGFRLSAPMKGAGLFIEPRYYYEFGKNGSSATSNIMALVGVAFGHGK